MKAIKVDDAHRVRVPELRPGDYYVFEPMPDTDSCYILRRLEAKDLKDRTGFQFGLGDGGKYRVTLIAYMSGVQLQLTADQARECLDLMSQVLDGGEGETIWFEDQAEKVADRQVRQDSKETPG